MLIASHFQNGVSLFDFRGAAPLAFACLFLFSPDVRNDAVFVVRAMLAATVVWNDLAAHELICVFPLISTLRWTILPAQLILPINASGSS